MSERIITRRDFLKKTGAAALVASAGLPLMAQKPEPYKSRVILIRHESVVDSDWKINQKIIDQMMDEAMVKLFDTKTADEAWKKIIKPTDIIGIKNNVWNYLPTPKELENNLKARIIGTGVPEKNISIDDRNILNNPVFKKSTALINARPMRAHSWCGMSGCLKNYIMFVPNPPDYHPDSCADLGALWKLPVVSGKTRLNVLVMLTPQFHCLSPHHFDKEYTWLYKGLLVGTDPVALDAVGLRIMEAKRKLYFKEEKPILPPVTHIAAADKKHGIGVSDLNKIELIKLGWKEGLLI
jgi:hypothetical protein